MPNTPNGRVTLAILNTHTEHIRATVDKILEMQQRDHDRLGQTEALTQDNTREINRLRDRDRMGTIVTGFGAVIAAVLGALGMRQ